MNAGSFIAERGVGSTPSQRGGKWRHALAGMFENAEVIDVSALRVGGHSQKRDDGHESVNVIVRD